MNKVSIYFNVFSEIDFLGINITWTYCRNYSALSFVFWANGIAWFCFICVDVAHPVERAGEEALPSGLEGKNQDFQHTSVSSATGNFAKEPETKAGF